MVAWLYDYTFLSVVVMVILLFCLFRIIVSTKMEMDDVPLRDFDRLRLVALLFLFGMDHWWRSSQTSPPGSQKYNGTGLASVRNGMGDDHAILITGAVNIFITWNRNMREFATVGAWGPRRDWRSPIGMPRPRLPGRPW